MGWIQQCVDLAGREHEAGLLEVVRIRAPHALRVVHTLLSMPERRQGRGRGGEREIIRKGHGGRGRQGREHPAVLSWTKPKYAAGFLKAARHAVIMAGNLQAYASTCPACVFASPWYQVNPFSVMGPTVKGLIMAL